MTAADLTLAGEYHSARAAAAATQAWSEAEVQVSGTRQTMGDLFKALTGGVARFVLAWMVPSVVTLGLFTIFLLPEVRTLWPFSVIDGIASDLLMSGILFGFFVLVFSLIFAYASLPIYRLLEGYSLPAGVRRRLEIRHLRKWKVLKARELAAERRNQDPPGLVKEKLNAYPQSSESIRATALGNALTAMEGFGRTRYGLDSQSVWYELQAVVPETVRKQTEEGRAPVDFFVSSIAHFALLCPAFLAVAAAKGSPGLGFIGLLVGAAIPVSYRMAVRNVKDWGGSVRALVNLGRRPLAESLGLEMPKRLVDERHMWASFLWAIEQLDPDVVEYYDSYRFTPRPPE
ncbi:MAG TPA: hypothetical protein VGK17_02610 [Propionicimonas sp.]